MKNQVLHRKIIKAAKQVFNTSARRHKTGNRAVLWGDQQRQYIRFAELIKYLDLNSADKTILDVGCGNGEFYKFLNFMGFRGQYVGYDINTLLLKQARKRFPGINAHCVDILTDKTSKRFNYVVMSGLFNSNVGQTSAWAHGFLKKMFSLCKDIMVFNAISTHVNYKDEGIFYLDPAETFSFCARRLSPRVVLAHHNLPYNFTMAVYKGGNWGSLKERTIL